MRYTAIALVLALLVIGQNTRAHDNDGPSSAERKSTAEHIAAARTALRALPSENLSKAQQARTVPRIVNGDPEVETGQWAWTVSVNAAGITCGGAYLSPHVIPVKDGYVVQDWTQSSKMPRWVVTAAHCLVDRSGNRIDNKDISVFGGTLRADAERRARHDVEASEVHNDYNSNDFSNDIALLRISSPVSSTAGAQLRMTSIRLPRDFEARWLYKPYTALTVHGWGRTAEGGSLSPYLQKVLLPHVDHKTCSAAYGSLGETISPSMICAGFSTGGFDSCQGDSGGPLAFIPAPGMANPSNDPILAGVVSWGYGCARQNLYGVYTNVLHMRRWLEAAVVKILAGIH